MGLLPKLSAYGLEALGALILRLRPIRRLGRLLLLLLVGHLPTSSLQGGDLPEEIAYRLKRRPRV